MTKSEGGDPKANGGLEQEAGLSVNDPALATLHEDSETAGETITTSAISPSATTTSSSPESALFARSVSSFVMNALKQGGVDLPAGFASNNASTRMIASNQDNFRIFRNPQKDPLEIALQYKVMALSDISNSNQTFTMTIMEDVAVWLTKEEFDEYVDSSNRVDYRPQHFVHTYVYNSTSTEWQEPNRTVEGCAFHIRDVFDDKRCWAFRQRQGKITFNQPFDLRNYPFDVQDLTCQFALYTYSNIQDAQRLLVRPMYGGATFSAKFVEPNDEYRVYQDRRSFQERGGYVSCTYKIGREWQYYIWRVVVVLAMVTLTALGALVSFESYLDQMSHLATVLLTDVAYLYTIQEHMPRLRYFTLLDYCVFGNILFVFLVCVQISVLELLDVDVDLPNSNGTSLGVILLIVNVTVWFGSGAIFAAICYRAYRFEIKKLGKPLLEEKMLENHHESFPINMSFYKPGTSMNCLLLKRRQESIE